MTYKNLLCPKHYSMSKQSFFKVLIISGLLLPILPSKSAAQKVVNNQNQSWVSINTAAKVYKKFSLLADVHVRRNNFFADRSFEFVRTAVQYNVDDKLSFAVGYAHMWMAAPDNSTNKEENRIFEQVQLITKIGSATLLQKVRNEQRWANPYSGKNTFSDRVRLLNSLTIPVFKNKYLPAIALADEVCVQFGRDIVYNTFDQNRWFVGIKQQVSKTLSFDLGYMEVLQQKAALNSYDNNHTFRWFFYYLPDFRKKKA